MREKGPFPTDVEEIRRRAREHVADDPTTRRMLEGILAMEEEHADDLAGLLARMDPKG